MIICDNCRQAVSTKIVCFGRWITDRTLLPSWDLCEECEKLVLSHIESFMNAKGRVSR